MKVLGKSRVDIFKFYNLLAKEAFIIKLAEFDNNGPKYKYT